MNHLTITRTNTHQPLTLGAIFRWSLIGFLLATIAGLAACSESEKAKSTEATKPNKGSEQQQNADNNKYVRVIPIAQNTAMQHFEFSGVTRAVDRAQLSFLVSGELTSLPIKIGDQVEKGAQLGVVRNPQLAPSSNAAQARLTELQTRLAQARRDRSRVANLKKSGAATREEYEQANAQYQALISSVNTAKANLANANQQLNEATLTAPFSGSVSAISAQTGDFVAAGQPIITLNSTGVTEIEISLPETLLDDITLGETVDVIFPFQKQGKTTGRISEIALAAPAPGKLFPVIVTLTGDKNVTNRSGMTANVRIKNAANNEMILPISAISDPGTGQPQIFKLNSDNTVAKLPVQIGDIMGETVVVYSTIKQPIKLGDLIVYAGLTGLTDGQTVVPLNRSPEQ